MPSRFYPWLRKLLAHGCMKVKSRRHTKPLKRRMQNSLSWMRYVFYLVQVHRLLYFVSVLPSNNFFTCPVWNQIIQQDVGPRLQKLKDDRAQYLEYQKVQREVDHLSRIYIAWKYQTAEVIDWGCLPFVLYFLLWSSTFLLLLIFISLYHQKAGKELQKSLDVTEQTIFRREQSMIDGEAEIKRLTEEIDRITAKISEVVSFVLATTFLTSSFHTDSFTLYFRRRVMLWAS